MKHLYKGTQGEEQLSMMLSTASTFTFKPVEKKYLYAGN